MIYILNRFQSPGTKVLAQPFPKISRPPPLLKSLVHLLRDLLPHLTPLNQYSPGDRTVILLAGHSLAPPPAHLVIFHWVSYFCPTLYPPPHVALLYKTSWRRGVSGQATFWSPFCLLDRSFLLVIFSYS